MLWNAAAATLLALSAGAPLPRGQVVEKIVCRESPGQSYALYLPSAYTEARPWPVAVRQALKDARRRDERDRGALRTLFQKLFRSFREDELPLAGRLAADLGIPGLRKKAASADSPEERLSAERLLSNLRVQTSYYMPEQYLDDHDDLRARLALSVAAEIDPDDPRVDYNFAAAAARSGDAARALKDLQRAVEKGFRRFEMLDTDPDFDTLRPQPAFQSWLAAARASP